MGGELIVQGKIEDIVNKYKPLFDALKSECEQMERDFKEPSKIGALLTVDVDVKWERTDIVFDIPSVRMKYHKISFDIPEVKMSTKRMVFDTPSVKMVTKKVGKYPCFKGLKWYSCDLKMDIPEFFMERQEIKMDIPEFSRKRVKISFDLPEFFMNSVRWSLHLPQIKIINVKAETRAMKKKAESLRSRSEKIAEHMNNEISMVMAGGFGESAQTLVEQRNAIAQPFNEAILATTKVIDDLVSKKIDPIKIPIDGGHINLRKDLEDIVLQRDAALNDFDNQTVPSEGAFYATHESDAV